MKRIFKQSCPYIVILAVSLLCALILEFTCFMREKEPVFSGETVSLLHEDAYTATPYGYKKENDLYTPFLNDPQLTFSGVDIKAQTLCIQFKEKMYSNLVLEVYYKKEGELFTSEDALPITNIPLGTDTFCIELPGEQYESIRIDINGTFYLKDVILSSGNVIDTVSITAKPLDALRLITCWLLIALLPLMGMIGHKLFYRKKEHSLLPVEGKTAFQEKLYSLALLTALIGISSIIIFQQYLLGERIYMFTDAGSDTQNVYYPFLMSLWRKLSGGDLSFWDFSHGMGANVLTRQADIGSPFTWLSFLLGAGAVKYILPYIHILKILLSGYVCFFYLDQFHFSNCVKVIVSAVFAFNGFSMLWGQHYFFATAALWAVLMLFSIERALKSQKGLIWVAFTTFLIALNSYYFAYMILIVAGVYALFRLLALHTYRQWREMLAKIGMLGGAVVLGIGMAAVLFLPAANIILSTSNRVGGDQSIFETLATFAEMPIHQASVIDKLLARILSNNLSGITTIHSTLNYYEAPQWFFSSFTIFFVCIYFSDIFFNKQEKKKIKVLKLCALFLIIHMAIHPLLSLILNGFVDAFYRYTFLIMPLLALCFADVMDKLIHRKLKHSLMQISIAGAMLVLFLQMIIKNVNNKVYPDIYEVDIEAFASLGYVYLAMSLILIAVILLMQHRSLPRVARNACSLLAALIILTNVVVDSHITANWRISTSDTNPNVFATNGNDAVNEALDYLAQKDPSFYRIEKTFQDVAYLNDGLLEGYYGVSVYNSVINERFITFVEQVCPELQAISHTNGYYDFRRIVHNPQLASLLGVKYILSKEPIIGIKQYAHIATFDDILVYQNVECNGIGHFYTNAIDYEYFNTLDDATQSAILSNKLILDNTNAESGADQKAHSVVHFDPPQNSGYIKGTVSTDAAGWLLMTIPFEDGWTAYVDGEKADIVCGDIAFSAIKIPEGEHEVIFQYRTPLLTAGLVISCVCFAVFIAGSILICNKEKHRSASNSTAA